MSIFEKSHSETAAKAYSLVCDLQQQFAKKLDLICDPSGTRSVFTVAQWLRDEGKHGGGEQKVGHCPEVFNRASINVSHVQYDDIPQKPLASANALSTIIHPANPHAPSVHIHISWTEMKTGQGYWRIMADLNPSVHTALTEDLKKDFETSLKHAAPEQYEAASAQGDRYFFIPSLKRHRGISHFYLEAFNSGDAAADFLLAKTVGEAVIDTYTKILDKALKAGTPVSATDRQQQLAYHTLYLFQVLTLDRGTTSGLLVHNQNDVGIMGSLPAFIDRNLLASWQALVPAPQDKLVEVLLKVLKSDPCPVGPLEKQALANVVRTHYRTFPEALELQARGDVVPPTVSNHQR